jgi:hypothetical protein
VYNIYVTRKGIDINLDEKVIAKQLVSLDSSNNFSRKGTAI